MKYFFLFLERCLCLFTNWPFDINSRSFPEQRHHAALCCSPRHRHCVLLRAKTFRSGDISICIVAKVTKVEIPNNLTKKSFFLFKLNTFTISLKITDTTYKDNQQRHILAPRISASWCKLRTWQISCKCHIAEFKPCFQNSFTTKQLSDCIIIYMNTLKCCLWQYIYTYVLFLERQIARKCS